MFANFLPQWRRLRAVVQCQKNRERQCCALPSTHLVNGVDLMGLSVDDEPIVAEVTQRVLLRRVKPKTQAADGAAPSAAGGVAAALFGAAFL